MASLRHKNFRRLSWSDSPMKRFSSVLILGSLPVLCALLTPLAARAQTELLLSTWEDFRNVDATPAAPFDNYSPRLPSFPTDQWFAPIANGSTPAIGSDVDLNQSPIGATNGTNSLKLTQLGTSRGGGDTHYNFATSGYFLFNDLVAGALTFPADRAALHFAMRCSIKPPRPAQFLTALSSI